MNPANRLQVNTIAVNSFCSVLPAALFLACQFSSAQENWSTSIGQVGAKANAIRINEGLKAADPNFPCQAVYSMAFLHPNDFGLPGLDEMTKANLVADQLDKLIAKEQSGKFAAVQTFAGVRKFLFYTSSEEIAKKAMAALKVPAPYKVELSTAQDSNWSLYAQLRSQQHQ